jgi:hypothetical protein
MTPALAITSAGDWISFYTELPELNLDLSRMMP